MAAIAALAFIALVHRRRRCVALYWGITPVSARSRELAGLIVAALLAGIALASVTIARDARGLGERRHAGARSSSRLYLVAHVVVRRDGAVRGRSAPPARRSPHGVR